MSAPTRKIFGTDGIRGEAGKEPLTPETLVRLGRAAAEVFAARSPGKTAVVIGRDTRRSGDMLEAAIAAGLTSQGLEVKRAGVIPTPAVAFLTRKIRASFGIVISASHNPFQDNGVKFFGPDGEKLDDATEGAIEQRLAAEKIDPPRKPIAAERIGTLSNLETATKDYVDFVVEGAVGDGPQPLDGVRIALDCANGSAFRTSSAILEKLGAEVLAFYDEPDGVNINAGCGCTHPEAIEALVRRTGADVGVSHDGDADRVALCDETGSALDGDELMAIMAVDLLERGELVDNTLVATLMSNAGLEAVLQSHGGRVLRANVGDRYVLEEMRKGGFNFGGEQSGHLVFRDLGTTGDGIVAAVQLLLVRQRRRQPFSQLRTILEKFPQAQRSVRVKSKPPVSQLKETAAAIRRAESALSEAGRVLVRYSGTEALLRILVEGRDTKEIEALADEMAAAAEQEIGA